MAEAGVAFKVEWDKSTKKKLEDYPSKVIYTAARMTLDYAYPTILKKSGKTRQTSTAAGVRQDGDNKFYIGSFTDYAEYAYKLSDSAKVTTPGTNPEWYDKTWNKKHSSIMSQAVERNKIN